MAGDTRIFEDSYQLEGEDLTEEFLFVARGSDGNKCKPISADADRDDILGIAQSTAVVGDHLLVRKIGHSMLKMDEAAALGDFVTGKTAAVKGRGVADTRPALAGDPPSAASVDAALDWAANRGICKVVDPAPSGAGAECLVFINAKQ